MKKKYELITNSRKNVLHFLIFTFSKINVHSSPKEMKPY